MITVFPITAQDGQPTYTAAQYRKTHSLLLPFNGWPFGSYQAVRIYQNALVNLDGLKGTVQEHAGILCPWSDAAYLYAIEGGEEFSIESSSQSYKVAVVLADPSAGHGETPGAQVKVYPASTPDSNIDGLVIATVTDGIASDVAPIIDSDGSYVFASLAALNAFPGNLPGTRARVIGDPASLNNGAYVVNNAGVWAWADMRQQTLPTVGGWNSFGIVEKRMVRSDSTPPWFEARICGRFQRTQATFTIGSAWLNLFPKAIPAGFRPPKMANGDIMRATGHSYPWFPKGDVAQNPNLQLQIIDTGDILARSTGANISVPQWSFINANMSWLIDS